MLHLTQRAFPSADDMFKFADLLLAALPSNPEPLLGFVLLSSDTLVPSPSSSAQLDQAAPERRWMPQQSYTFHNAAQVLNCDVRAAIAMSHSVSVRRDLCLTFSLAAARDSGALCTTRACHFPRELSFDFGFLSKYGA